ncbi:MAG: hypothetical protein NTX88_03675 [Candidatus Atribacteria bacterium]|nr:hypothetical protein [Candidatus Atribacteria bacterium]
MDTPVAYLEHLAQDREEAEALFRSLSIGYSEFFRDPLTFALLEQVVLPGLAEKKEKTGRGEIRVWSAGCAAGQEAWSVAILLEEMAAARGKPLPYRIFATDLSPAELTVARTGVYDAVGLQNVRWRHLHTYFTRKEERYTLVPRLRDRVDFSAYDLLDGYSVCPPVSVYGDFDLVLCCNLLFYYRPEIRSAILEKVQGCLAPGGYFVTGETEGGIVKESGGLRAVAPPPAVFQKIEPRR